MRAILVFVCFLSLALAGCGSDDSGSNGTGGTGNTSGGGDGDCQNICDSPCVDEVGLDQMELEACVEACEMGALDPCLSQVSALIECIEQFPDCEPTGTNCLNQARDFATCFGVSF